MKPVRPASLVLSYLEVKDGANARGRQLPTAGAESLPLDLSGLKAKYRRRKKKRGPTFHNTCPESEGHTKARGRSAGGL